MVRSDKGCEFLGQFDKYLLGLGVQHRIISTAHSKANGLVERYNNALKEELCKMLTMFPEASWEQVFPEVLAGLRALPSRSGISPFLVCIKQPPNWLGDSVGGSRVDLELPVGIEEEERLLG